MFLMRNGIGVKYLWIFSVLVFACSKTKSQEVKTVTTLPAADNVQEPYQTFSSQTELRDTVINDIAFKFSEIPRKEFDLQILNGGLPLHVSEDRQVSEKKDSCLLVKLNDGKIDSLCDKREGDNLMQYFVKGIWKPHNLLLLSFTDWEGGNDFLMNLNDGSGFNLGDEYLASADDNYLLTYSNPNKNPVNTSHLLFAQANHESIRTIFILQFEKITITNAAWIANNKCVLSTAAIEGVDEPIQPRYYTVTIN